MRRAGFGDGRCLVREVGTGGDAEGSRGWGQGTLVGRGLGRARAAQGCWGDDRRGEGGLCELVWFSTNLGRDVRLKGEAKVLQTAQLWVLLVLIFFPFPNGGTGQIPAWSAGRSWPGHRGEPGAMCCSLPCSPQFLGGWAETCCRVYKYSEPARPINVALGL